MRNKREKTMLEKSISMNIKISERPAANAVGWLVFAFLVIDLLSIPSLIVVAVYIFLAFRKIFDKSLFGEEAYTYMIAPISMKCVVIGKTIAACVWLMLAYMMASFAGIAAAFFFNAFELTTPISVGMLQELSGVFYAADDGVIGKGEIVYDGKELFYIAVYIVLMPILLLVRSVFICTLFQLGYAVRHVMAPNRDKPMVTVVVAIVGIAVFGIVSAVVSGTEFLLSGEVYTIWTSLLEIIVFGVCSVGMLAIVIKLLEKKYNLC